MPRLKSEQSEGLCLGRVCFLPSASILRLTGPKHVRAAPQHARSHPISGLAYTSDLTRLAIKNKLTAILSLKIAPRLVRRRKRKSGRLSFQICFPFLRDLDTRTRSFPSHDGERFPAAGAERHPAHAHHACHYPPGNAGKGMNGGGNEEHQETIQSRLLRLPYLRRNSR